MSEKIAQEALTGPLRLRGSVKHFAWGKVGSASRIFPMVPGCRPDAPLAEYWIGTHPSGPADVELSNGALSSLPTVIAGHPEALLGERCVRRFGPALPFMVKILSVDRDHGLSIQLHPTKEQARILRARAPESYPDDNHKPEVGVALTPVSLLYGCKSPHQIRRALRALPELESFVGKDIVSLLEDSVSNPAHDAVLVKELLSRCFSLDSGATRACVEYLRSRVPSVASLTQEAQALARLTPRYGVGDPGLIALVFMNHIVVPPGQAIFIAPDIPHAYLEGDLFECMACSDNVVRAGLTPKHKDVSALLEIIDCSGSLEGVRSAQPGNGGFSIIETPTEEFRVNVMEYGSRRATIPSWDGPAIVVCVGERLVIKGPLTPKTVELGDGGAVFIPPHAGEYELESSKATVFYVTV